MNKVKFLVFSDMHMSNYWVPNPKERLSAVLDRAKKSNVDFVIHCGDLADNPNNSLEEIELYNNFELPTYHTLGNHETDHLPLQKVLDLYKMPGEYYYFDKNGFRFIVLNANYIFMDGKEIPFSEGNNIKVRPYIAYLSSEQLDFLEKTVMDSPYPAVLFSHRSLTFDDYGEGDGLKNREDIQNTLRKLKKAGKKILMAINGHYHVDFMRIFEHTCYLDINAATMFYNPESHDLFPPEYFAAHKGAHHCLIHNEPLSAVITLSDDGTIEIEGMESSYFMGVSRLSFTDTDYFNSKRVHPSIMSEKIILPI